MKRGVHLQQRACRSIRWEAEELEASWIIGSKSPDVPHFFYDWFGFEKVMKLNNGYLDAIQLSSSVDASKCHWSFQTFYLVDSFCIDSVSCWNVHEQGLLTESQDANSPRSRTKQRPLDMFFGAAKASRQQSHQTIWRLLLSCWTWSQHHLLRCWLGSCDILRYCREFLATWTEIQYL